MLRGLWLSIFALFLWSCGSSNGITIIVNVSGVPEGTKLLHLAATLDGVEVRPPEDVPASAVEIAYVIPEGKSGSFVVQVRGLSQSGCAAAAGRGELLVAGSDSRLVVPVALVGNSPPLCPVEVHAAGNGTVSSNPTGLSCGNRCVVEIPSGSQLVLSASPGGRAYFSGWSGACAGYAPCELTVDHAISVGADFLPELCTQAVCWESPLPAGIDLYGIFGIAESDLWAVGESGSILHYDGAAFSLAQSPTTNTLRAVWGPSSNDIWAAGVGGTLLHYDGTSWTVVPSPGGLQATIYALHGTSGSDLWAVGAAGTLLHYNGAWTTEASGVTYDLHGVYASAAEVLLVGAGGQLLRRDATGFVAVGTATPILRGISGKADSSVIAVGDNGTLLRFDGNTVQPLTGQPGTMLRAVYARASDDAWVAGSEGALLHFDGTNLARLVVPTSQPLNAVFAPSKDSAWAVGDRGTIVHYDGRSVTAYGSSGTPDASDYRSVSGTSANDLWAVGNNNSIVHNSGQGWVPVSSGQTSTVNWRSVYAISPSDAWVVGNQGGSGAAVIAHWNGSRFTAMPSPLPLVTLNAVAASGPGNVWIGGLNGAILRWNGSGFTSYSAAIPLPPQIYAVAAVSPQEVWFGCAPTQDPISGTTVGCVLWWNGSTVQLVRGLPIGTMVTAAVAASNDIWFAGYTSAATPKGLALRIQNGALGSMHDFGQLYPELYGIGVRSGTDVWVSGADGTILHTTDGTAWNPTQVGLSGTPLYGITPAGPDAMSVVGAERTILRIF